MSCDSVGSTPNQLDALREEFAGRCRPQALRQAKRLVVDGPRRTVIDGPVTETKELIAGFSIWEVKDIDEAVAWAKRCPNPTSGPSEIEIGRSSRRRIWPSF